MKTIQIRAFLLTVFSAAVLTVAAFYDFSITQAVYSPSNIFGIVMEHICFLPLYVFVVIYPFVLFSRHKELPVIKKFRFIADFSILYCISTNTVVFILKNIWQRTRYADMAAAGSFELFTPWYQFGNGGSSFPSGHTAAACGILLLLLLPHLFTKFNYKGRMLLIISYFYIAISAYSRLVLGRHFLSDTFVSTIIASFIFWLMYTSSWCKKNIDNLKDL